MVSTPDIDSGTALRLQSASKLRRAALLLNVARVELAV